ncbi:hypothetical protein CAOG_04222 [Capsaspora owczarzaki ATCC 30864]|uniref:hypothetical protein n=1 Tax=Capsaspora owczarzaki (strain ATCC 30864) TaxID=595528 RepID=UPI0003526434|nr:hypothetical protein CAOG_04222 [Capsaspora owczarzaki ATCC 30864]|eukprot:XP_004348047.2 hypothetical protein CAOG_04222 [Capsaspora owczarzaki ATCC 30864]
MLYRIGEEELSISNQSSIEIRPRQNAGPKIGNAIKDFDIEGLPDQLATVDIQVPEVMDDEDAMDPNSYPLRFNWAITSGVGGVIEDPHSFKHVEVTNLRLGTYTVKLEVTDTDGHMTPTVFTIVYREPSLPIPVAHAGQNITVVLPNNTATLDSSQSTAAAGFKSIVWEADSTNPVVVTLTTLDDTQTRVEGLTVPGVYTFKLTVTDVRDYTSVDRVSIIVIEDFPPTAVAPAEYHISTTSALLELDGSQSTDDRTATANLGFLWEKQLESPAAGTLVDASLPVAKLVDFISGTYVFKLTVTDSAGQTATTLTSVYVENDDKSLYLLEIRLDANIEQFTESNAESVRGKLALALGTTSEYVVIDTIRSGSVIMTFHVVNTTTGLPIFAGSIVSTLRDLLHSSKLQVGFPILSVDPYLCDNTCSGHGTCDTLTKECVCDPYWVENVFATKFQGAASNCGWSVVYVILVCGIIFLVLLALGWAIFWACSKRCCKKGARKTMLDRRSRGGAGRFDSLELMPRSSQPGGLMNDSDGDGSDDDDEEEDIFDERYLVGGTPKPPPSSKVARMIRQSSQANVTPGTPSQNAARAASTSMILSHSDDEDQPFEGINGNAHAVAKAQQKPQQQQQPAGGASSFATPVRGLMSRLTGKTPNGKDANGHGNGTHANSSNSNNNNNNNSNNVSSPTRKPRGPTSRSGGYSRVSTNNGDKHSLLAKSDSWEDLNIE